MALCTCKDDQLCEPCFGRELTAKRGQARTLGQCWAERVARRAKQHRDDSWPEGARALEIARRQVAPLARDPRLVDELALACLAGAAAWWAKRPERYR